MGSRLLSLLLLQITVYVQVLLIEFVIYDRYDTQVFFTRDRKRGWDGTLNDKLANSGTYVYSITGKDNKGPVNQRGLLLLTR